MHFKHISFPILTFVDLSAPYQSSSKRRIQVMNLLDGSEFFCEIPMSDSHSCGGWHRLLLEKFNEELPVFYEGLVDLHDDLCQGLEYSDEIQQFVVECAQLDQVHKSNLWVLLPKLSDFFKTLNDAVNAFKLAPEISLAVHLGVDRENTELNSDYVNFYECFVFAHQDNPSLSFSEIMSSAVRGYFELHQADNMFISFALDYATSNVEQGVMMSFFKDNIDAIYSACMTDPFLLDSDALYEQAKGTSLFKTGEYQQTFKTIIDMFNDRWIEDFSPSFGLVLDAEMECNIREYLKEAISSLPRLVPDFMIRLINTDGDVVIAKSQVEGDDELVLRAEVNEEALFELIKEDKFFMLDVDRVFVTQLESSVRMRDTPRKVNKDDEALALFKSFFEMKAWMNPQEVEANFSVSLTLLMAGAKSTPIMKSVKFIMNLAMDPGTEASRELVLNEAYYRAACISICCRQCEDVGKKATLLNLSAGLSEWVGRIKSGDFKSSHVEWTGKLDTKERVVQQFMDYLMKLYHAGKSLHYSFSLQSDCNALLDILPETTPKEVAQKKVYRILFDLLKIVILNPEEAGASLTTLVNELTTWVADIQTFEFQNARALLIVGLNRFENNRFRTLLWGIEHKILGMAESVEKESAVTLLAMLIRIANKEVLYIDGERVAGKYAAIRDNEGKGDCFYLALADAARVAVSNGGGARWGAFDHTVTDVQRGRQKISAVMALKLDTLCSFADAGKFERLTLLETPDIFGSDFSLMVQLLTSFKRFTEEMARKYSNIINIPGGTTAYGDSVRDFERFERPVFTRKFEALFEKLFSADVSVFYDQAFVEEEAGGRLVFTTALIRELLPYYSENCALHRAIRQKLNEQIVTVRGIFPTLEMVTGMPAAQEMIALHPATALAEAFDGLSHESASTVLVQNSFLMHLCQGYATDVLLTPTYFSTLRGPVLETLFSDDGGGVIDLNDPAVLNDIVNTLVGHMPIDQGHLAELLENIQIQLYAALTGGIRLFDEFRRETVLKTVITRAEFRIWFRQQTLVKWAESPEVTVATSMNKHVEVSIQQNHGIVLGSIHESEFVRDNLDKPDTLRVMTVGQHYVALDIKPERVVSDGMAGIEAVDSADSGYAARLAHKREVESRERVKRMFDYLKGSEP